MEAHSRRRRIWLGAALAAIVIVIVVGVIKFRDNAGAPNAPDRADASQTQTPTPSPAPTPASFGREQNDAIGYDNVPWGTDAAKVALNTDEYSSTCAEVLGPVVAKIIGAPVPFPSRENLEAAKSVNAMGIGAQAPTFKVRFPDFISMGRSGNDPDHVCYGFVDRRFAFAVTYLGTADDDGGKALEKVKQKYRRAGSILANDWGEERLPDWLIGGFVPRLQGSVFKRGESNTRVYYLEESYSAQSQNPSVYLVFIPNAYWQDMQQRWRKLAADAAAEALAKEQKERQLHEQQKDEKLRRAIQ